MISIPRSPESNQPLFAPGQLVRHRRYDYRGVVVARDLSCQADDEWYLKNQTQPNRSQPWYHVLVDRSPVCTYAAAENLVADETGLPVDHPLVDEYFTDFRDGEYVRNNRPWGA